MKTLNILLPTLAALLALSACDTSKVRSAKTAQAPVPVSSPASTGILVTTPTGPVTERANAVSWNQQGQTFEFQGKPLITARQWVFSSAPNEFMVAGAAAGPAEGLGLAVTETQADVVVRSAGGLNLDGGAFPLLVVRLTRVRQGADWDGSVHYTTIKHPESEAYLAKAPKDANPGVNETVTIVYDMEKLRRGGDDWKTSKIDQIRLDLDDSPGGAFILQQIAVAKRPAGYP